MKPLTIQSTIVSAILTSLLFVGCHSDKAAAPAPQRQSAKQSPQTQVIEPTAGKVQEPADAIHPDILTINDDAISVDEMLYAMRDAIEQSKHSMKPNAFRQRLEAELMRAVQQEIGTVLIYALATRDFDDARHELVDGFVKREINTRVAREFGGSLMRFDAHLEKYHLTREQFGKVIKHNALASNYAREMFLPKIHLRRDELLAYYKKNTNRYAVAESRELMMITVPYASMLPDGTSWKNATDVQKASAKKKAQIQCKQALAALKSGQDFSEVAKQYSKGPLAAQGGNWGMFGQPLKGKYEVPSRKAFELRDGEVSNVIETEEAAFVVTCGEVVHATQKRFDEVQAELRAEMTNNRVNELSAEFMQDLMKNASIGSVEAFVKTAVDRAMQPNWPELD